MKKTLVVAALAALFASGCSTTSQLEYYSAIDAANARSAEVAQAQAQADQARTIALTELAATGDETSRVAAVMALAFSSTNAATRNAQMITPVQPQNEALEWARVFAGPVTTLGMGYFGYRTSAAQISASRDITLGSYDAMVSLGNKDPVVVTQPEPTIVDPRDPVVVVQPEPIIVDPRDPVIVDQPPPIVAPDPIIVQPPEPRDPIVVPPPDPIIVQPPEPRDPIIIPGPEPIIIPGPEPIIIPGPSE